MHEDYLSGFAKKCAELGVDADAFAKAAIDQNSWLLDAASPPIAGAIRGGEGHRMEGAAKGFGGGALGGLVGGGAGMAAGGSLGVILGAVLMRAKANKLVAMMGGDMGKAKELWQQMRMGSNPPEKILRQFMSSGQGLHGAGPVEAMAGGALGALGGGSAGALAGSTVGSHMATADSSPREQGFKDRMAALIGR
jgi:hypothetical protein